MCLMVLAGDTRQFLNLTFVYRASLAQYQQPKRWRKICFIDSFKLAVHVSGESFAHLQEHFDCIYSFSEQCTDSAVCSKVRTLFQKAVHTKCSWRWVKLSPETCTASLKESIKQILLHLLGCWYHCTRQFISTDGVWVTRHLLLKYVIRYCNMTIFLHLIHHPTYAFWYTIYDMYHFLHILAPWCHPQGVIMTKIYKPTLQSMFFSLQEWMKS